MGLNSPGFVYLWKMSDFQRSSKTYSALYDTDVGYYQKQVTKNREL